MNIIITMAGLGSRFREAGYTVPKYMIDTLGKTLFEWSMSSLESFFEASNRFIFIVRKEDHASDFIQKTAKSCGIDNQHIIEIDYLTDGQSSTAMLAKSCWIETEPVLIYNIDTFVDPNEINPGDLSGDGAIPCFTAEGTHWSFAKLGENGLVCEVREKERISNYCTVGAYYFKSCALFESLCFDYYKQHTDLKERYIAPVYNLLIEQGGSVRISLIDSDKVHVLGTPDELAEFQNNYRLKEVRNEG